jgi:hypothetical protein
MWEHEDRKENKLMALPKKPGLAQLVAWAVIFGVVATPAQAVDTLRNPDGTPICIPAEKINAQLEAEGQKTIIVGDRPSSATGRPVTIRITSRPDGTLGNIFEGDGSFTLGIKSTCFAVRNKLTDVRLNDPRNPTPPIWGFVDVDPAIAKAALARDKFGRAGVHNDSLRAGYKNGYRLLMIGRAFTTDGTRLGPVVSLLYNENDPEKIGTAGFTNGYGVANTMFNTIGTTLTAEFYQQLFRNVQGPSEKGSELLANPK